jgi:hypothetical protein
MIPAHAYEVRSGKDQRRVDLISDALPLGSLVGMPYGPSEYLTITLSGSISNYPIRC